MSNKRKIIISIGIGLAIGILITGLIFLLKFSVNGKFPPKTFISGIDVSYKTPEEAKEIISGKTEKYLVTPLEFSLGNTTKTLTPKELGIEILVDKTIQILDETNAKNLSIGDYFSFFKKQHAGIDLLVKIDDKALMSSVKKTFDLEKDEPLQATFYFDENSVLSIKDGKPGKLLNESQLISDIKNSAKQLNSKKITLIIEDKTPDVTKEMLVAQEAEIKDKLNYQFALLDPIYSDDWYVKLKDHLDWVIFEQKDSMADPLDPENTKKVVISINQDRLNEFVDKEISKWLDVPAEPVKIYTDEQGKVVIEGKGDDGLKIQRESLKKGIEIAVNNKIQNVPIPVAKLKPEIIVSDDLKALGIKERLGVGHTSFYNSPQNRVHNIRVGSSQFNGNIIAPDEVFSFNTNLGRVDGTTGYKKELVIKKEGTIREFGGGICQVSTTMYRTILFSGLPIVERNPHAYAVSYYSQILGHGLDATIYLGGSDLKFKNDTGKSILVQAYMKGDYELYIVFYGTSDGREVRMDGPYLSGYRNPGPTIYQDTTTLAPGATKQVEKSHTGFYAVWYRYLTDSAGKTTKETIETTYRAIPAKILVGIAENVTP